LIEGFTIPQRFKGFPVERGLCWGEGRELIQEAGQAIALGRDFSRIRAQDGRNFGGAAAAQLVGLQMGAEKVPQTGNGEDDVKRKVHSCRADRAEDSMSYLRSAIMDPWHALPRGKRNPAGFFCCGLR